MENSGIVLPMLKQLGIDLHFHQNPVTIGIADQFVRLDGKDSVEEYGKMLIKLFPENANDVESILKEIRKVMGYMEVLYGIDNPFFMDLYQNPAYFLKTVLPWLFRYKRNVRKAVRLNQPIKEYLRRFTPNQALIDVITQHFFQDTPAFFALSYFNLYLNYYYPEGGTGSLPVAMEKYIRDHEGEIRTKSEVIGIDAQNHIAVFGDGTTVGYGKMIWAADSKTLFSTIRPDTVVSDPIRKRFFEKADLIKKGFCGDSVFSVFLSLNIPPEELQERTGTHLFFTPSTMGLSQVDANEIRSDSGKYGDDPKVLQEWMIRFLRNTTYEISVPALRFPALAPFGKTAMIVSTLMDYELVRHIADHGWYEDFKRFTQNKIIGILNDSLIPGLSTKIIDVFSSSPLTIEKLTGNSQGAITGWSFRNHPLPVMEGFSNIASAVKTVIPDIFQAGAWSFSPSGLPVSILTGKLAADAVLKKK
jgi:phytoene dehydrogenase-like protein